MGLPYWTEGVMTYHRTQLEPGDRVRMEPGSPVRTVLRVTPGAAYLGGEPREVTITDPRTGATRTFTSHEDAMAVSRRAFVYTED